MPRKHAFRVLILLLLLYVCGAGIACAAPVPQTEHSDSLENLLKQPDLDDSTRIQVMIELATDLRNNNMPMAIRYITEALRLAEEKSVLLGRVYFTAGNVHLNRADYKNALLYYLRSLKIYEKEKKYEQASRCLNNVGVVYSYLKNLPLSEKYFKEALAMREKNGFTTSNGVLYTSIGFILSEKGAYKEALHYYNQALVKGREEKDRYVQVIALANLGSISIRLKKFALARQYLHEALGINSSLKDYEQQTDCYMFLSEVEKEEGNLALAEKYLVQAVDYAEKAGIESKKIYAYEKLSEVLSMQKKYEQAYRTRLTYEQLHDSALNENSYKQVNELQALYDFDKKNNEIALLNKDKELAVATASRQQLMRNILIVVCLFITVTVIILVRNVRLKQRLNQSLKTKNIELVEENIAARYEILKSKIDPHFLFNSLNTLSSMIHVDKEKAVEFIEQFSILYRNILESGEVNLFSLEQEVKITNSYLYLQKVRFGDKLNIGMHIPENTEGFVPPFALQMVVENAIKHNIISSARKLNISVYLEGSSVVVENNLQKKSPESPSTGIGQKNISGRYKAFTTVVPEFIQTAQMFRVRLPIIHENPRVT